MSDMSKVRNGVLILAASVSIGVLPPCLAGVSIPRYMISEFTAPIAGATDLAVNDLNNRGEFLIQFNDPSSNYHYRYVTDGENYREVGRIRIDADDRDFVGYDRLSDDGSLLGFSNRDGPHISTSGFKGFLEVPSVPRTIGIINTQAFQDGGKTAGNVYAYEPVFGYASHAVRWQGSESTLLEEPPQSTSSVADMNADGSIIGVVRGDNGEGPVVPTMWTEQGAIELDIPGIPRRINDAGEIAFDDGYRVGVSTTGGVTWLPNLPGTLFASVRRFRDRDLIVGYSVIENHEPQLQVATAWVNGRAFRMQDLLETNDEWVPLEITDMNNNGWIIGTGTVNGREASFLMKPAVVPLPAGVWATAITVPLVWWRARRANTP